MNRYRILAVLLLLPFSLSAADRSLKVDPSRSYVDVDVSVTIDSFTGRLDRYDAVMSVDDKGKIKTGIFSFKFRDLKTGKSNRDSAMLEWLGGNEAAGKFELGLLALTPSGQGQVTGNLTFHGTAQLVEFPVNVTKDGNTYTVTGEASVDYTRWGLKTLRRGFVIKVDPVVKVRFKFTGDLFDAPVMK